MKKIKIIRNWNEKCWSKNYIQISSWRTRFRNYAFRNKLEIQQKSSECLKEKVDKFESCVKYNERSIKWKDCDFSSALSTVCKIKTKCVKTWIFQNLVICVKKNWKQADKWIHTWELILISMSNNSVKNVIFVEEIFTPCKYTLEIIMMINVNLVPVNMWDLHVTFVKQNDYKRSPSKLNFQKYLFSKKIDSQIFLIFNTHPQITANQTGFFISLHTQNKYVNRLFSISFGFNNSWWSATLLFFKNFLQLGSSPIEWINEIYQYKQTSDTCRNCQNISPGPRVEKTITMKFKTINSKKEKIEGRWRNGNGS